MASRNLAVVNLCAFCLVNLSEGSFRCAAACLPHTLAACDQCAEKNRRNRLKCHSCRIPFVDDPLFAASPCNFCTTYASEDLGTSGIGCSMCHKWSQPCGACRPAVRARVRFCLECTAKRQAITAQSEAEHKEIQEERATADRERDRATDDAPKLKCDGCGARPFDINRCACYKPLAASHYCSNCAPSSLHMSMLRCAVNRRCDQCEQDHYRRRDIQDRLCAIKGTDWQIDAERYCKFCGDHMSFGVRTAMALCCCEAELGCCPACAQPDRVARNDAGHTCKAANKMCVVCARKQVDAARESDRPRPRAKSQ
jgi:hypothetical protein